MYPFLLPFTMFSSIPLKKKRVDNFFQHSAEITFITNLYSTDPLMLMIKHDNQFKLTCEVYNLYWTDPLIFRLGKNCFYKSKQNESSICGWAMNDLTRPPTQPEILCSV